MKNNIFALLLCILCFPAASCQKEPKAITSEYQRDYLIVVNQDHPYDFNGEYAVNLKDDLAVTKRDEQGDEAYLEYKTLDSFHKLRVAARKKGIIVGLFNGYRDKNYPRPALEEFATTDRSETGYSEHHTGLSISIVLEELLPNGEGPYWLSEGVRIPENEELTEMLPDYGFIRRYPAGKEEYTGHAYEPYEIRFVGSPEVAHAIMDEGLCLEEYVQNKSAKMAND